jgi:uncharacterized Zn-binding protein involved in type VI secretion
MFKNKTLLITGGTGSFGNAVLERFLHSDVGEIRIFSRDEKKQEDLRLRLKNEKVKFYIGDGSTAGGILIGGSGDVIVNGNGAVRVGDKVAPHGNAPHNNPTMIQGSGTVFVNGKSVCRAGNAASCGHSATGSGNVFAG